MKHAVTMASHQVCCVKINSVIIFALKDPVSQIFTSSEVYKFQCGLRNESYYGECIRHLAVRGGEHIGILPLTNKKVQLRKDSVVCHHLLNYNYSPTFEDFRTERKPFYNER